MTGKKVYVVIERKLVLIDSVWEKKAHADIKANTLNIYKTPIENRFKPAWSVEEHELL